jgi:protein-tyrosine phosphatase
MPDSPDSFLFVCKGNICRSPFAEQIARKIAEKENYKNMTFFSAGLEVKNPDSPPEEAKRAAENFGIFLNHHSSRKLTRNMLNSFDVILAMDTKHFKALRKSFPEFQNKIFLLSLFDQYSVKTNGSFYRYNIFDPYGKSLEHFHICFQRIERCLLEIFMKLRRKKIT